MDFLKERVLRLYRKYLAASLCSALVMSIYSSVDAIAVGQSEGPLGAAAMAVITPLYGVMAVVSILIGIGGSVLLGNARGEGNEDRARAMFTSSLLLLGVVTVIVWAVFGLFPQPIFQFFGADATIYPKTMEYAQWIIRFLPVFLFAMYIGAFIRNDGAPSLAMAAVILGGGINIFLDWYLVFPLHMGMRGAAIATVTGTCVQAAVLCSHFFRKGCELRLVKPTQLLRAWRHIFQIGVSAGVLDGGNVVLTILINNQIMKYGGADELAIYGVLATVTALFQSLFYGVGQAIQPLVSYNFGDGNTQRVKAFLRLALLTVLLMGVVFLLPGEVYPTGLIRLFIDATPEVLTAAPGIVRLYSLMFLPLGITVLSIYYLQSTLRDKVSMLIAVARSVALSGALIYVFPLILGLTGIWIALPVSETMVAIFSLWYIRKEVS